MILRLCLLAAAAVGFRATVLALTGTDLFFDEAQYWAWGQSFEFGYFSKPPLIGWVIGGFTELVGSDAAFWVRLPAAILHGITGVIVGMFIGSIHRPAAVWATAVYLSMPIITVGSWMFSTDTVMAPLLAGAVWLWWRYLNSDALQWAICAGLLAGLAGMAKYAGGYFFVIVAFTALFAPPRPRLIGVLVAAATFLIVLSPNLIWNLQNGGVTFSHTADNADWDGNTGLNWQGLAEFIFSQIFVIGPAFFITWLASLRAPKDRAERFLMAASLPIVLMICGQALMSKAFGNWAFAAYLTAAPLVALRLVRQDAWRWLYGGLALNIALTLGVSALIVWPAMIPRLTDRFVARQDVAKALLNATDKPIVATERAILADLTYAATRDGGTRRIYALPNGPAPHHWYDMTAPLPQGVDAVFVGDAKYPPLCQGAQVTATQTIAAPPVGAYQNRSFGLFPFGPECR